MDGQSQGDNVFSVPLREVKRFELSAWADRVISALPPPSPNADADDLRPSIQAKDTKQAAQILIFLVNWWFMTAPLDLGSGGITPELHERFALDFARAFPVHSAGCRLVPLVEVLRHARHLDIEV